LSKSLTLEEARQEFIDRDYIPLFDEYKNCSERLLGKTKEGYFIIIRLNDLKHNKNPRIFSVSNPYTIQNIILWCKLNHKPFKLLDNQIYKGNKKKLNWLCLKENCNEVFEADWSNILQGHGCGICNGMQVRLSNCLATLRPDLVLEWHPTKNGDLTPWDVTCGSEKDIWWICDKGHEWKSFVKDRNDGNNCPYCSGRKVLKGYNDLWTTHPEIAKLLKYPEQGYEISHGTNKKQIVICPEVNCKYEKKVYLFDLINNNGFSCPKCGDGFSYPNKFMFNLLDQLQLSFIPEYSPDWIKPKRYDFYFEIDNKGYIVEMDGAFHNKDNTLSGMSVQQIKENDKFKDDIAQKNKIKIVRINCDISDLTYIKNNILKSELTEILNLEDINWLKCHEYACNSLVKVACDLWNSGLKNTKEIADKLRCGRSAATRYLKRGVELGWCDYKPQKGKQRKQKDLILINTKEIFNTIVEASIKYKINAGNIYNCCNRSEKRKSAGKHPITGEPLRWMYYEDWQKYMG